MGLGKIYFENQALEMEDLPPRVLYTSYPILGEMGNKKQPFSPLPYIGLSKSSVKFDPQMLEAPSLHTLLIYEGSNSQGNILADPRKVKTSLSALLNKTVTAMTKVKSVYSKMAFIQHEIKKTIARYDFIDNVSLSPMGKIRITFKDDELAIATTLVNQYIMEEVISVATPRNFAIRPIGLGGKERFVNLSILEGYKGLYTYLSPEEPPLMGRYPRMWTLSAFLQILYMLPPQNENKLNENSLIKAAFIMEQFLRNGIDIESIEDAIQILPWWSRWTLRPSYMTLPKEELKTFVMQLFVLGRYMHLMRAAGVDTLIYPTRWHWTGKTLASTEFIEGCFRGNFSTSISGVTSLWAWPASSMYLKMGEWQIMGMAIKKRNFWHQVGSVSEMKVRSSIVFVDDKDVDFPNLIDEGYDAMLVSLEPNMKRARQEELYHIESQPPRTILKAEWIGPLGSEDNLRDIFQTILIGGQPLFSADLLVEFPHELMSYENMELQLTELANIHKSRKKHVLDGLVKEKISATILQTEGRGLIYPGDELNVADNGVEKKDDK